MHLASEVLHREQVSLMALREAVVLFRKGDPNCDGVAAGSCWWPSRPTLSEAKHRGGSQSGRYVHVWVTRLKEAVPCMSDGQLRLRIRRTLGLGEENKCILRV
jgi:hypothetical protein